VAVLAIVMVAAACGGDDDDDASTAAPSTTFLEDGDTGGATAPSTTLLDDGDEADSSTAPTTVLDQPLSSCFWSEPINREQSNSQFPDSGATYWYSAVVVPDGATVRLRGEFPHARYASYMAYGADPVTGDSGTPFDGLADVSIIPDEGSTNPFEVGADRTVAQRSYEVELVGEHAPANTAERAANTLYGVPAGEPTEGDRAQELIYRVYVPDEGRNLLGDTGLPELELELADGSIETGEAACATLQAATELPVDALPSLTEDSYATLRALGEQPTHPAQLPVVFTRFFNARHATFSTFYAGTDREPELAAVDATPFGGYYSNLDNQYVLAVFDRALGPDPEGASVAVITGIAPSTPRTRAGAETMEQADLRYWSVCQNESSVTTRVADCLYDEQVPRGPDGRYTIVVSRPEDRPDNATPDCGVGWLDWGPGDGVDRPEYGLVIVRHMLPSPGFGATIANVAEPGDEAAVLDEVLPSGTYETPDDFEARGCAGP
jgi:hypothetical protein